MFRVFAKQESTTEVKMIQLKLYRGQRRRLGRAAAKERDAEQRQRYLIILGVGKGQSPTELHRNLGAARSTVYRVIGKFMGHGEAALQSRRPWVAPFKLTESYVERLEGLIWRQPKEFGWGRSTWTSELLSKQLEKDTGISFHRTHVNRLLRYSGIRWGRPKPVGPRWANPGKSRRIRQIERLLRNLGPDEVALYADEVDVDLNPRIGPCWMPKGVQFEIPTPGQNQKLYLFGGLNTNTGRVIWIPAERKNSAYFVRWLEELGKAYRKQKTIYVICDNYIIHKSGLTQRALKQMNRIRLEFLPPYSPEHNPIERLWGELHNNVTRNHRCHDMDELLMEIFLFMDAVIPYPGAKRSGNCAVTQV